jgi:multidrug efflux system membrane fusion protein
VADVAGVVTAIEAEPGQVVTRRHAGGAHRAGRRPRRGVLGARGQGGAIRPGSEVAVRGWAGGAELEGKVREVAASADP